MFLSRGASYFQHNKFSVVVRSDGVKTFATKYVVIPASAPTQDCALVLISVKTVVFSCDLECEEGKAYCMLIEQSITSLA